MGTLFWINYDIEMTECPGYIRRAPCEYAPEEFDCQFWCSGNHHDSPMEPCPYAKNFYLRNKIWQKAKSIIQYIYKVERSQPFLWGCRELAYHPHSKCGVCGFDSHQPYHFRRILQMIYKIKLSLVRSQHCKPLILRFAQQVGHLT